MGNINAKRATKKQKNERKLFQETVMQDMKSELIRYQEQQARNLIKTVKESDNEILATNVVMNSQFQSSIINTAKEQIQRGGMPFTKADLIAIICFMRPEYVNNTQTISEKTVSELNAFIRMIIYNPKTYENTFLELQSHVQTQHPQLQSHVQT